MPKRKYALEREGSQHLEISWKGNWKNTTIRLDGEEIGSIATRKDLRAGREFPLPDGSTLEVQLDRAFLGALNLRVLRDGEPLPGSAFDPIQKVRNASTTIFFIAGLNILVGAAAALLQSPFLRQLGLGWRSVIFGCIYLALGFFVMRRRSLIALIVAAALFAIDGILGMVLVAQGGGSPSAVGLIVRVFLLLPLLQGIGAIRELKR